jgi:hypothetical protein
MRKNIFLSLTVVILAAVSIKAQVTTSSPYSRYGIGEIERQSFGQSLGMGGVGIGLKTSMAINPLNPASYSAFPMQSFIFQAGMRMRRTDFSTVDSKYTAYDNSFNSAAIGFRANKYWAASFGLMPVSSVGYQIKTNKELIFNTDTSNLESTYGGTGGLTKIYFGNAFNYKQFSVGINASYVFGTMTYENSTLLADTNFVSAVNDEKNYKVKDFIFDFGVQYRDTLSGNWMYTLGATFSNRQDLKTTFSRFSKSYYIQGTYSFSDTIINDTIGEGNIQLPMNYGLGFSLSSDKWLFAFDYSIQKWKGLKYLDAEQDYLADSRTMAFGAEYTPKYNSKNFFQTINYRIGGQYSDNYLKFGNTQIKDYSVNLGFGIPIKKSSAKIDISFEAGQHGTTTDGLILQEYYLLNLNFNMGDIWFIKRKFE